MSTEQKRGGETPRKVIAVVTDAFAPFHREVLECIRPHFTAAGFGTLGIAGRDVRTDRRLEVSKGTQGLYRGAFGTQLDVQGAVIVCGAMHPAMSSEAVQEYTAALTDGPVVSLGIHVHELPSVEIEWPEGITDLMQHVLSPDGRQRLAFVQGFPGDPHSEMRELGFREALSDAGVPVDERLIVPGNFSVADAHHAVADLLAAGLEFDGLVAANDDMAVGAIAALTAHGLSVPHDVVVAGFDDALSSIASSPPLTTVRLDNLELTAATARLVLSAIESGVQLDPGVVVGIDCALIVRESTSDDDTDRLGTSLEKHLAARWDHARIPEGVDPQAMASSAAAELRGENSSFLTEFQELCTRALRSPHRIEVTWLRHVWRELQATIANAQYDVDEASQQTMLSNLLKLDRVLCQAEARQQTERTAHQQLQERLIMRLASCSDAPTLWRALRAGLHSIGMVNAWVMTPERVDESQDDSARSMELVFSLAGDNLSDFGPFDARRILPSDLAGLLEQEMHVLVPLRAGDSDIGYMVVEPQGEYLLELEAIASGIAQVLRHVGHVADLERQKRQLQLANEALDRLARQDTLTGLANRKHFVAKLEQHIADIGPKESLAMVFLDLDGFKQINDTLGHSAGDQLLRIIADRLSGVIEETDTLARLGGDEFTIIVHDPQNHERALDVAEQTLLAAAEAATVAGHEVSVTASVGISTFPLDGETAEALMGSADIAMYAAKDGGKNRFEVFCDLRDDRSAPLQF